MVRGRLQHEHFLLPFLTRPRFTTRVPVPRADLERDGLGEGHGKSPVVTIFRGGGAECDIALAEAVFVPREGAGTCRAIAEHIAKLRLFVS